MDISTALNLSLRSEQGRLRALKRHGPVVVAFLLAWQAAWHVSSIFEITPHASAFYPPAGLTAAFLVLFGPLFTPVVMVASLIAGAQFWFPTHLSTWIATSAAVSVGYGAGMAWFRRRMERAQTPSQMTVIVSFCAAATFTALGATALHALAHYGTGAASATEAIHLASVFWVGDLVGVFTVVPLTLLVGAYFFPGVLRQRLPWLRLGDLSDGYRILLHTAALLASLVAMYAVPLLIASDMRLVHLLFVPAIWIALSAGLPAALWATFVLNVGNVLVANLIGHQMSLSELQSLMLGISAVTLVLGAMATDRAEVMDFLEQKVAVRTQELTAANAALAAASRAKTDFLLRISHELRTPLHAILGFAELIQIPSTGPQALEQCRQDARSIQESGTHLLQLVSNLLDLSKAEAGRLEPRDDMVALAQVIHSAMRMLEEQASKAGVTLVAEVTPDLPLLRADPMMLAQIVLNLLSNAVKFTPAGGTVRVTVTGTESGGMVVSVNDNGIGIAPEHIARVLEPFGQVDSLQGRQHRGTGMGLPIVKSFVEAHQGLLTLESELGVGTTARVHLPATRVVDGTQSTG